MTHRHEEPDPRTKKWKEGFRRGPVLVSYLWGLVTADAPEAGPRLARAGEELLEAARRRVEQRGGDPDAVTFAPADPDQVDRLVERFALPAVYAEFLRRFASKQFLDSGLRCQGVGCWIVTADGFERLQASYVGKGRWPSRWVVCAAEDEGCYYLDTASERDGDCAVSFLPHGSPDDPSRKVADSFVQFLETVARDTSAGDPEPGARLSVPPPGPAEDVRTFLHFALLALIALGALIGLGWYFIR